MKQKLFIAAGVIAAIALIWVIVDIYNTLGEVKDDQSGTQAMQELSDSLYNQCQKDAISEYTHSWDTECSGLGRGRDCSLPTSVANKTEIEYSHRVIQCVNQYK